MDRRNEFEKKNIQNTNLNNNNTYYKRIQTPVLVKHNIIAVYYIKNSYVM
jgi:hypothetical protein